MDITRRNFLKVGGFGAGASIVGLGFPLGQSASTSDWISTAAKPARFTRPLYVPRPVPRSEVTEDGVTYDYYEITEKAAYAQLLDAGAPMTPVMGYAYGAEGPTVPGPLIKVQQGTPIKMRVKNALPTKHPTFGYDGVATSVHLHGSASLPQYDGYADDVTLPTHYKDYYYPNHQGPRTLWYHDHGVHHTAQNAYSGLLAQYHITNPWEQANLPQGDYDVPLVVSDAMFAKDGKLAYMDRDHAGLWGDVIMVNGVPWPYLNVERRFYRFRVLLATLSRSMNLKFVNTRTGAVLPTYVVATDGGLMPAQQVTSWRHAGAERYEVMVDFKGCRIGDVVELQNGSNKNNVDYLHTGKVMQFRVKWDASDTTRNVVPSLPDEHIHPVMKAARSRSRRTRNIDLEHDDVTNEYMINGKTWHDVQAEEFNLFADGGDPPRPGDFEIWEIENKSGGWYHPLHIHLVDFQILSRRGGSGKVQPWEKGPKDVAYVGEGEIIEVLVQYATAPTQFNGRSTGKAGVTGAVAGRYMIHCHNLAHEDNDMMGQFFVAPAESTGIDVEHALETSCPNFPIQQNEY